MAGRRRHRDRRHPVDYDHRPVTLRVGNRRSSSGYREIQVADQQDGPRFARLVADEVRLHPNDPLVISVNDHQRWLAQVLEPCIADYWDGVDEISRELQFAGTAQFPERASKRARWVPWTFIVDHMNVPQVYYWSVGMEAPKRDDRGLPSVADYRFRVGVWFCPRGACTFNPDISVTIVFTRPTPVSEHVVCALLFNSLYKDHDFDQPRQDEEGVVWVFSHLYWLLTDWQNIIHEVRIRLDEAEENSRGRDLPVKYRTLAMHKEISRIYELQEYLHFQSRAFKKLKQLKDDVPKQQRKDPLWGDIDDSIDDLDQFDAVFTSLKERFNNLLNLEYNIQNADQSDNSAFLSAVATIFLPISYLASVFGITTITWPPIWYLYIVIPVIVTSAILVLLFRPFRKWYNEARYHLGQLNFALNPTEFTLLGQELPENTDVPGGNAAARSKRKWQRPPGGAGVDDAGYGAERSRSQARSRSRFREEKEGY